MKNAQALVDLFCLKSFQHLNGVMGFVDLLLETCKSTGLDFELQNGTCFVSNPKTREQLEFLPRYRPGILGLILARMTTICLSNDPYQADCTFSPSNSSPLHVAVRNSPGNRTLSIKHQLPSVRPAANEKRRGTSSKPRISVAKENVTKGRVRATNLRAPKSN